MGWASNERGAIKWVVDKDGQHISAWRLTHLLSAGRTRSAPHFAMASTISEQTCYTIVREDTSEGPSSQELRNALQKGTDEVKLDTLRTIIVSTLNGNPHVSVALVILDVANAIG